MQSFIMEFMRRGEDINDVWDNFKWILLDDKIYNRSTEKKKKIIQIGVFHVNYETVNETSYVSICS